MAEGVEQLQAVAAQLLLPGGCHLQLGSIAPPRGAAVEAGLLYKVAAPDGQALQLLELSNSRAEEGRLRRAVGGGVHVGHAEGVAAPLHAQGNKAAICRAPVAVD